LGEELNICGVFTGESTLFYSGYVGIWMVAGVSLKRAVPYCCLSFTELPGAGYSELL
jgi:hypothetical protein